MQDVYVIVGLGNPGAKYEKTRHNIGFHVVEALARKHGLSFSKQEHKAMTASGTVAGQRVILVKPQTFMNVSGDSVVPLVHFYKVPTDRLLVVSDDLDTPLGTLRLRASGSSGGQNGLKHILSRLGTQDIARAKLGISRPPGKMDPAAWVMTEFKGDDAILAVETIDRAVKAIETWLVDGIELAMTRHNGTGEEKAPKNKSTP